MVQTVPRWALSESPSLFAGLPGDIEVSFEFFPPKTPDAEATWWRAVDRLSPFSPSFVSVTYGAGGGTRDRSLAAVRRLGGETGLPGAAHLTCVGASRHETDRIAEGFWEIGVRHIVALRGDGGAPGTPFSPHPHGYESAAELVAALKRVAPFEISVAAYPEVHPDAASAEADLDNLTRKFDAGACGAKVPDWLEPIFSGLDDHPEPRQLVAATVAAEFCRRLYAGGVRDFHFYTLNRAELTQAICHLLGRRLGAPRKAAA